MPAYERGSEEARQIADRIVEKVKNDEAFRERLSNDAASVLIEEGVPREYVGDCIYEFAVAGEAEVAGYRACAESAPIDDSGGGEASGGCGDSCHTSYLQQWGDAFAGIGQVCWTSCSSDSRITR
jgi:hypothetical protein